MVHFWERVVTFLNEEQIPYMLSGSMAMTVYTLGRSTQDFDFIVHLKPEDVNRFLIHFRDGYYLSADALADAYERKTMFNVIDQATGFKVDFILLKDHEYRQVEFSRRQKVFMLDKEIYVVSGEDLLISKLIWIQELESGRQKEDIIAITKSPGLDWNYVWHWIEKLNLNIFDLTLPNARHT